MKSSKPKPKPFDFTQPIIEPSRVPMSVTRRYSVTKSFKIEVQTDDTGKWYGNAVRYPDEAIAEAEARSLFSRWTAVKEYRIVTSEDEPNRDANGLMLTIPPAQI